MRARALGLLLGYAADLVWADPARHHPVAWFGTAASRLEQRLWRDQRRAGAAYAAVLVGGVVLPAAALERRLGPGPRVATTAVATWVVLGGTSLDREAAAVRDRLAAEAGWLDLWRDHGVPLHIFRLAGIYGPGRGPFAKVRAGTARRIIKPGQVFSRIHVEDIAQALELSLQRPDPGAVYNLCDDDPAPPQDVIAHAAALLGLPVPPAIPFDQADMTPMARSFYAESKKVRNDRIKQALGWAPQFPTYRAGLAALLAQDS